MNRLLSLSAAVALVTLPGVVGAAFDADSATAVGSPSDGLIAYTRTAGPTADAEIWLMGTDGANPRRLVEGCCFDWSPDGREIAFLQSEELYTVGIDGRGLRRLARDTTIHENEPDWSPDGRRIAYEEKGAIFIVNADGTERRQLTRRTPLTSRESDDRPRWSPDGKEILFERFVYERKANGTDLFVVNRDGSGLRRLTHDLGAGNPDWSPDGTKIAYFSDRTWGIYVMNADGTQARAIAHAQVAYFDPIWSPGGDRILFSEAGRKLHTIDSDGRHHRRLTPRERGRWDPRWSPDGRSIVFARAVKNALDIYVMTAQGKNVVNLTNTPKPLQERSPAWSP